MWEGSRDCYCVWSNYAPSRHRGSSAMFFVKKWAISWHPVENSLPSPLNLLRKSPFSFAVEVRVQAWLPEVISKQSDHHYRMEAYLSLFATEATFSKGRARSIKGKVGGVADNFRFASFLQKPNPKWGVMGERVSVYNIPNP